MSGPIDDAAAARAAAEHLAAEGRRLAAAVADTEDEVVRVHTDLADQPGAAGAEAARIVAHAKAVARHEREAAAGGRLFRSADVDVPDPG